MRSEIQIGRLVTAIPAHEIVENRPKIIVLIVAAVGAAPPDDPAGSFNAAVHVAVLIVLVVPPLQEYPAQDPVLPTLRIESFEQI